MTTRTRRRAPARSGAPSRSTSSTASEGPPASDHCAAHSCSIGTSSPLPRWRRGARAARRAATAARAAAASAARQAGPSRSSSSRSRAIASVSRRWARGSRRAGPRRMAPRRWRRGTRPPTAARRGRRRPGSGRRIAEPADEAQRVRPHQQLPGRRRGGCAGAVAVWGRPTAPMVASRTGPRPLRRGMPRGLPRRAARSRAAPGRPVPRSSRGPPRVPRHADALVVDPKALHDGVGERPSEVVGGRVPTGEGDRAHAERHGCEVDRHRRRRPLLGGLGQDLGQGRVHEEAVDDVVHPEAVGDRHGEDRHARRRAGRRSSPPGRHPCSGR